MHFIFRFLSAILRRSAAGMLTMGLLAAQAQEVIAPQSIDSYLSAMKVQDGHHNSVTPALAGQGAEFVNYGGQYGVDPRFIVAISGAESSFGVRICTANNAWNWFWEGPCPKSPFDSFASGVHTVSHFMHSSYIIRGYNTIDLIGARYCVTGCEYWVSGVTTFYRQMGADVNILTWTPPPAPAGGGQVAAPGPPVVSAPPVSATPPSPVPTGPAPPLPIGPAPEKVTLQSVTLTSGAWWENSRSVTVTAQVSGLNLLADTVDLWQEAAAGHARTRLATLSQAPGSSTQRPQFTATVILSGGAAAELYVAAAFKHGKTQVVRTSTAMPEPAQPEPPAWIYILLAVLVVLVIAGAVLGFRVLRRRGTTSAPAVRAA